jgi:2-hydroxychromene-2-carboxylate isomerase
VPERPIFYYDLGSPYAYLAAERVNGLFADAIGEPPVWQPILLGALFKRLNRDSWMNGEGREEGMREVERRASTYGLPPLRWPQPCPANTLFAMRVAAFAKDIGKTVSFSLAAFRQAFAAGRDLTDPDNVLLAAAAAEIHPRALLSAAQRDSVKLALRDATEHAADLGVAGVPSVFVDGEVFWGDDRLEAAVASASGKRDARRRRPA